MNIKSEHFFISLNISKFIEKGNRRKRKKLPVLGQPTWERLQASTRERTLRAPYRESPRSLRPRQAPLRPPRQDSPDFPPDKTTPAAATPTTAPYA
jgi:hypothetical protein